MALVLVVVWLDLGRTTPGPLSPVHSRETRLAGSRGCAECHGEGEVTMADACLACHAPIAEQLAASRGLHGALAGEGVMRCQSCHIEHHGDELALVDARAFALAGIPERERFAHEGLDFDLGGRHAELECSACHANADVALLAAGETRFLGLAQGCTGCHDDPHAGAFGVGCAACHGEERPFPEAAAFAHTADFALADVHAGVACARCHDEPGRGIADLLARAPRDGAAHGEPVRACSQCHDSPHREGFLALIANASGTSIERGCARCHPLQGGSFAGEGARLVPGAHALTGFGLEGAHAGLDCAACHEGGAAGAVRAERDAPAPHARACVACHASPHAQGFLRPAVQAFGVAPAESCATCHPIAPGGFRRPLAKLEKAAHAWSGFPLEAPHAELACTACHAPLDQGTGASTAAFARSFPGRAADDCAACHADPHAGAFERGAFAGEGCSACHDPGGFLPVAFTGALHERTRFPLHGAHQAVGCYVCHLPAGAEQVGSSAAADATRGHARSVFGGTPTTCAACHADVHEGLLDEAPGVRPGAEGCARCHDAGGFDGVRYGFDHVWTGFALAGAHAELDCARCHPRHALPTDGPEAWRTLGLAALAFPGPRDDCATCHGDPHHGAFDAQGGAAALPERIEDRTGCVRCHVERSFQELAVPFDHGAFTGFELDGAHALASCAACHPSTKSDAEVGRVFGSARGVACADCHADPHVGQFARPGSGGATDCARCHAVGAVFAAPGFDHGRDSRFALDQTHAKLACAACHRPAELPGGGTAVRYKPLGVECADCHDPRGGVR